MKKFFLTGFITLLPLVLTIIVIVWLFNLITDPLAGITEKLILAYEHKFGLSLEKHKELVMVVSRIVAFLFLLALTFILGAFGKKLILDSLFKIMHKIFSRVPIIGTIYRLSHDITRAIFSDTKKTFKKTVLVPFPHQDSLAMGLVTGETPSIFNPKGSSQVDLSVFVPTAPHPMSGFILLTPKKLARPVDVSVEDAFKFLISCGVIHPGEPTPAQEKKK